MGFLMKDLETVTTSSKFS